MTSLRFPAALTLALLLMTERLSVQSQPSPSVVGMAAVGLCSGVQVSPDFLLTSHHCVDVEGSAVTLTGPSKALVAGRVQVKNPARRLAIVCSLSTGAQSAKLGSTIPAAGAAAEVESRSPKLAGW